jgi:dienelactone hydrolase
MTIQSQAVDYTQDDATFEGYYAWNDAVAGPCPCVLVAHAWGGLGEFEQARARDLAELGYAAFCIDLYGKGVRGTSPEENAELMQPFLEDRVMLQSRLTLAVEIAAQQAAVDASRMAAIGYCFGGLCVLDMARVGAAVLGVVSFHGIFHPPGNTEGNDIDAKVLALHGWDDPMATPEQAVALAAELTAAGSDWQIHGYGHTLHAFTNPAANDPARGTVYNETADRRSWRTMTNFFEELF